MATEKSAPDSCILPPDGMVGCGPRSMPADETHLCWVMDADSYGGKKVGHWLQPDLGLHCSPAASQFWEVS